MLEQGLIVERRERPAPEQDDERRRYYRITPFGSAVARAEADAPERAGAARARRRARAGAGLMRLYRALLLPAARFVPLGVRRTRWRPIFARRRREARGRARRRVALARERWRTWSRAPPPCTSTCCGRTCATLCRSLRRAPGFTLTVVLVSALGIGATTAAFSVTDHVLIRPLPFPEPDRLVKLWQSDRAQGYSRMELAPANYRDWQRSSTSFEAMGGVLQGQREPGRRRRARCGCEPRVVTHEVLPLVGTRPLLGRHVHAARGPRGRRRAPSLLSHGLWRERFGADPDVLGRTLLLDDEPYQRDRRDAARASTSRSARRSSGCRCAFAGAGLRAARRPLPRVRGAAAARRRRSRRRAPSSTLVAAQLERAVPEGERQRRRQRRRPARRASRSSRGCCCSRCSARRSACC